MKIYEITLKQIDNNETYTYTFETKKEAIAYNRAAYDCNLIEFKLIDYDYINSKVKKEVKYQTHRPYKIINN